MKPDRQPTWPHERGDRVTTVLRFNAAVSNVEFPKRLALFLNRNHARIEH